MEEKLAMLCAVLLIAGCACAMAYYCLSIDAVTQSESTPPPTPTRMPTGNSPGGNDYFVSTSGSDSSTGLSEAQAWKTIAYAATRASAGDTVHIKAGNYGAEHVVFTKSGTQSAPIVFQGYKNIPGDIAEPPMMDFSNWRQYGPPVLDSSRMPLLANGGSGFGMYASSKAYIELKNIQITGYEYGLEVRGSNHITVNNVVATECDRAGLEFRSCSYCSMLNSVASDCDMCDIIMRSGTSNSRIQNCQGHDSPGGSTSDYAIVVHSGGHNNLIHHCLARNVDGSGHGIGLKAEGAAIYDCTVEDCISINFNKCFYVRHTGVYNNTFLNDVAIDTGNLKYPGNGFVARDGAHDNLFIGCRGYGLESAIMFYDTGEDTYFSHDCGSRDNVFSNCVFTDSQKGVWFNIYNTALPAKNNLIRNCVFNNGGTLSYHETNNNTGNVMKDSIVTGFSTLRGGPGTGPDIFYSYNDFFHNGFSQPSGTGNIVNDPLFANAAAGDYHLKSRYGRWNGSIWVFDSMTSPCIDAGDLSSPSAYEPQPNGNRINIGAYGNTIEASKSPGNI